LTAVLIPLVTAVSSFPAGGVLVIQVCLHRLLVLCMRSGSGWLFLLSDP